MRKEMTELAATVRVLMRKLAEANLLDVTTLKQDIADELRYKGPASTSVVCTKCGAKGMTSSTCSPRPRSCSPARRSDAGCGIMGL